MINKIKELLNSGNTITEVAASIGVTYDVVRHQMRKHNVVSTAKRRYTKGAYLCKCGEANPTNFYGNRKSECKNCHNKKTHDTQKANKKWAVQYKGGECEICGYSKSINALQFHHKTSSSKDPNYSTMSSWGKARMKTELHKCQLLCANCHAEEHERIGYTDF